MVQLKYQSEPLNIVPSAVEEFYWLVSLLVCLSFFLFLGRMYGISFLIWDKPWNSGTNGASNKGLPFLDSTCSLAQASVGN